MVFAFRYFVCLSAVLSLAASSASARIISVAPGASIQAAINTAVSGDEIVLQPGTYKGTGNYRIEFFGKAITVRSTNPDDPAVVAATIVYGSNGSYSYSGFVFDNEEGPGSVVAGLTIKGCASPTAEILKTGASYGDPDSTFSAPGGSAIMCLYSSPSIRQCVLTGNGSATIFFYKCAGPHISCCQIQRNGAAIASYHSQAVIDNCIITDNDATSCPGLYAYNSQVLVLNCLFLHNSSNYNSPIASYNYSLIRIRNTIVWHGLEVIPETSTSPTSHFQPAGVDIAYSIVEGGLSHVGTQQAYIFAGPITWGSGNLEDDPALRETDLRLKPGSPCIDAGDPDPPPDPTDPNPYAPGMTDVYNVARVVGGRVDIGPEEWLDTDGDSLPDWWETKYFGSPTAADPAGDPDGDGLSNLQEYLQERNPLLVGRFYVDAAIGNDSWDGTARAWDGTHGPKASIQAAIDAAAPADGDTVIVAPGTYSKISITKRITVTSTDPLDPTVVAATVISTNEYSGVAVLVGSFVNRSTVISGFTAIGKGGYNDAYAVVAASCSATITHCVMRGERGLTLESGSPHESGNPLVTDCIIENSTRVAIMTNLSATILRCTIRNNPAGCGIDGSYPLQFRDCLFQNNSSPFGGALDFSPRGDSPTPGVLRVDHCTFVGNQSTYSGGAISASDNVPVAIENCVFSGNAAPAGPNISVRLWRSGSRSPLTLAHSLVQGGMATISLSGPSDLDWTQGNIDADPMLTPDGRLLPGSPCIDAGDPAYVPQVGETDIDGQPRIMRSSVDIGADEFAPVGDANLDGYVDVVDLLILVDAWGSTRGDANYDTRCDFNHDGAVDVVDLLDVVYSWGT